MSEQVTATQQDGHPTGISIYNSMVREKVPFTTIEPGRVRMYVCGLTVYDDCHIGHARTYVAVDVIRRYLEYRGFDVTYVQNVTDVDDKIIKAANDAGVDHLDHSRKYTERAFSDLRKIGIRDPDATPKVTDHMDEILAIIQEIIDNGHAYATDKGNVWFDVPSKEGYGRLSNRTVDELKAGTRKEVDSDKHHPADFALWKAVKPGEPSWDSPWGKGRPGWHIECSAMSEKTLGQPFDLHGGGRDLIFPHHENEVAQSEAAKGMDFAKFWFHTGFLNVEGEKMSKSLGNFITVRDLIERYDPNAVRYYYVLTHYRSPIDFSEQGIKDATAALERLARTEEQLRTRVAGRHYRADHALAKEVAKTPTGEQLLTATEGFMADFCAAMDDDFNTPQAVAALHAFAAEIRKALNTEEQLHRSLLTFVHEEFIEACHVLTLFQDTHTDGAVESNDALDSVMQAVIQIRASARANKDWATADAIRDAMANAGIEIEDGKDGATWRRT